MTPTTPAETFNLSTSAKANGRISGMTGRSPLNRTVDDVLASKDANRLAALAAALASRLEEATEHEASTLRRFNRINTRNAGRAYSNAMTVTAAIRTAIRNITR
jgi:hypothetical protein